MADNNRRIEYMAVSELMTRLHPQNPKEHDIPMIAQSFQDHGFVSSGTLDERTGLFLCGHGRTEALQYMIDQQMEVPRDIDASDGEWYCPVECGYSSLNDAQALAYIAIDNQATIAGDWNKEKLVAMLTEIQNSDDIELSASGFNEDQLSEIMTELKDQIDEDGIFDTNSLPDIPEGALNDSYLLYVTFETRGELDSALRILTNGDRNGYVANQTGHKAQIDGSKYLEGWANES